MMTIGGESAAEESKKEEAKSGSQAAIPTEQAARSSTKGMETAYT